MTEASGPALPELAGLESPRLRVALVTTPPSVRSWIGDYTRHLLPSLRELCDVELFVESGTEEGEYRPVVDLRPKDFDQVLYQLGNEVHHAFMTRMIRAIGGTVMQHDWVLFDLACAAYPALTRGGPKGHLVALREGGLEQARRYLACWRDRRQQRTRPAPDVDAAELAGTMLAGWHHAQEDGRWTGDAGLVRIPARGVRRVEVEIGSAPAGRVATLEVDGANGVALEGEGGRVGLDLPGLDEPVVGIRTRGISVTAEQRAHGDGRRLGSFVSAVRWADGEGEHELDLSAPVALPLRQVELNRDRFELPFNRTVVRHADAFVVHSEYVRQRILRERNQLTPVGVLPHGAERRWRDTDRRDTRTALGLPDDWREALLVVAFGGVQPHKRIDRLMLGVARARERGCDVRLLLAGGYNPEDFDPVATAVRLGIDGITRVLGFVSEETAWDCMHAGDVGVNLRGPTSGGTSGGIYQTLAFGRPVICTDAAEQSELPDACILKVPLGEGEVEAIAALVVELAADPARRAELERAARAYVDEECHWSHCARRYVEILEQLPGPRATRKSLIRMRVEEARKARAKAAR